MTNLLIPCIDPEQIFYDLEDCITSSHQKVSKRLARLRVVCELLNIDADAYLSSIKKCKEQFDTITMEDIISLMSNPVPSKVGISKLEGEWKDDSVKKYVEEKLTAKLNSDMVLYHITCMIMCRLFESMKRDSLLGPHIKEKNIILVHKGGIAQRLVLSAVYSEHRKRIEQAFGLGGDNDCNIIINPTLEGYQTIHDAVAEFVWTFLRKNVEPFSKGVVKRYMTQVASIDVNGEVFHVSPSVRNHFRIDKGEVDTLEVFPECGNVYLTRNNTPDFYDDVNRRCKFTLIRMKAAFNVAYGCLERLLGAEILDVSIPHQDEVKMSPYFYLYQSGQWVRDIRLGR